MAVCQYTFSRVINSFFGAAAAICHRSIPVLSLLVASVRLPCGSLLCVRCSEALHDWDLL